MHTKTDIATACKVDAIFGFCSIPRFEEICDALHEHALIFTNHTVIPQSCLPLPFTHHHFATGA